MKTDLTQIIAGNLLREIIIDNVGLPPHVFKDYIAPRTNPQFVAKSRVQIINKCKEADEVEFLPEQKDQILFCVSCVQPALVYSEVEKALEAKSALGVKSDKIA